MRNTLRAAIFIAQLVSAASAFASPITLSFTSTDVQAVMQSYGAPLHDATYQWGLTGVHAAPMVSGGGYNLIGGSVNGVPGGLWTFDQLGGVATFQALPGSEHLGVAAHPLYMIADQPANTFQSYRYDNTQQSSPGRSVWAGVCDLNVDPTGCNVVNLVSDQAFFNLSFTLDPGATFFGWQFLVDGSKYYQPSTVPAGYGPSLWVADFIGGDADLDPLIYGPGGDGGGLPHNIGDGYQVILATPEPATLSLVALGVGIAALVRYRRRTV